MVANLILCGSVFNLSFFVPQKKFFINEVIFPAGFVSLFVENEGFCGERKLA